ncbi:MAG: hypothetical protein R6X12_03105 [bacterium]
MPPAEEGPPPAPAPGILTARIAEAARTTSYLRVLFSVALLVYAAFGPGLLIRFPFFLEGARISAIAWFHGFRPAIFALVFVSLIGVLAALARRALLLFEEQVLGDCPGDRVRYIRNLAPSPFPFVLSGNVQVDVAVFVIIAVAYCFWAFLLVEAVPAGMGNPQIAGVVLGTYGLLGGLIVLIAVWSGLSRRLRRLTAQADPARPAA